MLSESDKLARRSGLGGTDAADLAEGKAFRVYASKVDGVEREIDPALARRGHILEPAILELYRHETGAEVSPGGFVRHPSRPFILGNLDGRAKRDGAELVLEAKSVGRFALGDWGEPGTDQIPQRYIIQTQWYMGATGLPAADVAALLGGDLAVYRVEFDPELFGMLAEMAERFWRDNVLAKRPPPPDSSEECADWLAARFPKTNGQYLPATPAMDQWAKEYRQAQAAYEAAQERRDKAKNALKFAVGEARGAVGDGWKLSWSKTAGRKRIDWDGVCAEAGVSDEVVAKHTSAGADFRVFRLNGAKDE